MARRYYSSVKMVRYEVQGVIDDTHALDFLEAMDGEFEEQLHSDNYLLRCYGKHHGKRFWSALSRGELDPNHPRVGTTLQFIVRSLKQRAKFAVLQHERLCRNIHYLQGSEDEKDRVKRRVNGELFYSMQVLAGFRDHPDIAAAIQELEELHKPTYRELTFGDTTLVPTDDDVTVS